MRMGGMRSSRAATVGLPAIALMANCYPALGPGMPNAAARGRRASAMRTPRAPFAARRGARRRARGHAAMPRAERPPPCARIVAMSAPETEAQPTTPADITAAVEASFDRCADPRLREIMQALVRHLHAFATEVRLTEGEWRAAIATLTATGHITDERRQEFILWSDALGLSILVDALANPRPPGATESTR